MARGAKRTASKALEPSAASGSRSKAAPTPSKKAKRAIIELEVPKAPTVRGMVLTTGQGDTGQLGLGDNVVDCKKFLCVSKLGDNIVDVRAGGMHTIALDKYGKVWSFGCNDEGALGRATTATPEGVPGEVILPSPAVAISAGDSHSAALLANGIVYAWGSFRDSHGSMGLVIKGRENKSSEEPVKIDVPNTAVAIASGSDHLVILTISRTVYTLGCGEQGQLGRLTQRSAKRDSRFGFGSLLTPTKVGLKSGASRIWAGSYATFALDATGEKMYAWGLNNYGQLGVTGDKRKTAIYIPIHCDAFDAVTEGWKEVACGQHHSLALDAKGQVYAIGRHEYGRLGLGDRLDLGEVRDATTLEPITSLPSCISIAAGTSSSLAVTTTGEVWAWGMGSEGQLGTGKTEDASVPVRCVVRTAPTSGSNAGKALKVTAGGQHSVVLVEAPDTEEPEMKTVAEPVQVKKKKLAEVNGSSNQMDVDEADNSSANEANQPSATAMEVASAAAPTPALPTSESNTTPTDTANEPPDTKTTSETITNDKADKSTTPKAKQVEESKDTSMDVSEESETQEVSDVVMEASSVTKVSDATAEVTDVAATAEGSVTLDVAVTKEARDVTKDVSAVTKQASEVSNEATLMTDDDEATEVNEVEVNGAPEPRAEANEALA